MISDARVPSFMIFARSRTRLFEIWSVASEPAQAGISLSYDGGNRLIYQMGEGGS